MEVSRELLFFFSALGAFNGLLMGFYFLFYVKPKHISNYFLGGLLIMMSIRIGKSVIFYFNPDLAFIYLQIGLSACFFIGPFLYFYLKSIVQPETNIHKTWKHHVGILLAIIVIVGYLYPFETNIELWRPYFIKAIYLEWLAYIIASAFLIKDYFKNKEKKQLIHIWALSIFVGNLIIWAAYYFCGYTSYILGALSFSFMLYLLILLLVFNKKKDSVLFKKSQKYLDKKIETSEANELLKQLMQVMADEKLYKNAELKLSDVAQKLNILPQRLSQLLNDNLGKSFPSYINKYRIEEAKKLLLSNNEFSIEGIGYECGFNSKSTFYSSFKKHMGTTPAKYKEQMKTSD